MSQPAVTPTLQRGTSVGWVCRRRSPRYRRRLMPTPDDVRRLALALPEAYEDTHRRKPAFRVNQRIFAMLGIERPEAASGFFAPLSGKRPVASLTVDREDQLNFALAYPQAFVPAGSYGFSYVWLDAIEPDLLTLLIRMSWARAAPKRLTLRSPLTQRGLRR
jgi:hypothetical protein